MLPDERRQYILDQLEEHGRVLTKVLSDELDLSEDAIRRDLRMLAEEGLLQRVHGGALPASPAVVNFEGREAIHPEEKAAIGQAAARMVQPGQVVILDGGTTAVQVARSLHPNLKATIVTHSARVAVELVPHAYVDVILIGGWLNKHSIVSVGAAALEAIANIHADMYFMGVTGISTEVGLTTGDFEEARVKYALSRQAADTYVLSSSEKLGAASPYVIAPLSEVTGLIVEQSVSDKLVQPFEEVGLSIIWSE